MNDNFLTLDEFNAARQKIESIFHVERRLPDQVFKQSYQFQLLCEFDFAMVDVLETLRKTQSPLAHESVLLSVLDPDPISFFYERFRKIYAFYFKANISEDEHYHMRWREPGNEAKSFPFHTKLETYIPSSASWAMWGESSREIAVIGLNDPVLARFLVNENGYWTDAETALDDFASMPYRGQKVPEDFRHTLIANYGTKKDMEDKLGRSKR